MFPGAAAILGAGSGPAASYVGSVLGAQDADPRSISFPPGTKAGDLAFIMSWNGYGPGGPANSISGGAGGWTRNTINWSGPYGYQSALFSKVLASGDLAGVNLVGSSTGSCYIVAVYSGATGFTIKTTNTGAFGTTVPFAGITKASNSKGLMTLFHDRNVNARPVAPANFVRREAGGFQYFAGALADLLQVGLYTNGDALAWTNRFDGLAAIGWLIEFT